MAETPLADDFKYPIKDSNAEQCLQAHKAATGGTYPIGKKNRSWHTGLHFSTDKPIVAIADGEIVAYRFTQDTLQTTLGSKTYSDSFVLMRHFYKSTFGNVLDFYSLYMHLDPAPKREFCPAFLSLKGYIVKGNEHPAPGLVLYKRDKYSDSLRLVPKYSYVTFSGEPFTDSGSVYREATYTDIDGTVYDGVFKYKNDYFKTVDGKTYLNTTKNSYTYAANRVFDCCKNLKGALVRADSKDNAEIVGFIPDGVLVTYEDSGKRGWGKLTNPLPSCCKSDKCYIKLSQLSMDSSGQPDSSLLGSLQFPSTRIFLQKGSVIGGAGQYIHPVGKKIVHVEIFTLQDLSAEDSILGDPKGEAPFSNVKRYVVTPGQSLFPVPLDGVTFASGDTARILEEPDSSQYVKVQITGMFRSVKYSWLDDPNTKTYCAELNTNTYYYKPKAASLNEIKKQFNGWIDQNGKMYRVSATQQSRNVLFPCATVAAAQVWVIKSALGEKDTLGNVKFVSNVSIVYSIDPGSFAGRTSQAAVTLDNPGIMLIEDKKYARFDANTLVDIAELTPQTPFSWGGFELMGEDPANFDAFMDFPNVKSQFIVKKGELQETQTARELEIAIKTSTGEYDLGKIENDKEWSERLQKLIVKVPSEWHYSDDKYSKLPDNAGDLDLEEIKKLIRSLTFWDDCKAKSVFDATNITEPFSDNAKTGKEVWCFHPLAFLNQMSLLTKAGLTPTQKLDFDAFIRIIRAAAGDNVSDMDSCKALAASFAYRLKKHEWIGAPSFRDLAARHHLKEQVPTDDEYTQMVDAVSGIYLDKKWSGLPDGFVLFHNTSENIDAQPWDADVLDTASAKSVGAFKFYKYKDTAKTPATVLIVKSIKLIEGGDKGVSLPCGPGEALSVRQDGAVKPYRYEVKSKPVWKFEFTFNIKTGTDEIENLKRTIKWDLHFFIKNADKVEESKQLLSTSGNNFTLTVPEEITDYTVRIVPKVNIGVILCDGYTIAIKKKEQLVFNGANIKWLDENGTAVPFGPADKKIESIEAVSGSPEKRTKDKQKESDGPIPEDTWWLERNKLESIDQLSFWDNLFGGGWDGGEAVWGKYRIKIGECAPLTPDQRSGFYLHAGDDKKSKGDIVITKNFNEFIETFSSRVVPNGSIKLMVDYSKSKFVPPSKYMPWNIKQKILKTIASFESGRNPYGACNCDLEFEGRWDLPAGWYKQNKAKPDNPHPKVKASKYWGTPRHIGLSFGLIQFTQSSSLPALIKTMNQRDPQLFRSVFGENSDKLLQLMTNPGPETAQEEDLFDNLGQPMGKKAVKRAGTVQPVGGHDLWESYWTDKFKESAKQEVFQDCQIECAIKLYMDTYLGKIVEKNISTKSIALVYDRNVNEGKGNSLVVNCIQADEKSFWTNYIASESSADAKNRMTKILNDATLSWDEIHTIKNQEFQ
jgi:hypothetical protein